MTVCRLCHKNVESKNVAKLCDFYQFRACERSYFMRFAFPWHIFNCLGFFAKARAFDFLLTKTIFVNKVM